jgi:methyl-accepting chemotaxis protein
VEEQIERIASAASEQISASNENAASVGDISNLAAENSQASIHAAEACKDLSKLAGHVDTMIRQFNVGGDNRRVRSAVAA